MKEILRRHYRASGPIREATEEENDGLLTQCPGLRACLEDLADALGSGGTIDINECEKAAITAWEDRDGELARAKKGEKGWPVEGGQAEGPAEQSKASLPSGFQPVGNKDSR